MTVRGHDGTAQARNHTAANRTVRVKAGHERACVQAAEEHSADSVQATTGWTGDPPRQWQITAALRACSKGMYCEEAATELIISHRSWLLRDDFTGQFILTSAASAGSITAVIDWEEALTALRAGHLPCSSSEAAILHLAASLATASPVILRHAITGLDQTNLHLVINAVRRAGGQN